MIDLTKCEGWQKRDADGMVMPWYVHTALDEIRKWSLSNKTVFEYGVGQSTLWWAKHCKFVKGMDINREWANVINQAGVANIWVESHQSPARYTAYDSEEEKFDIIVVDGDFRDHCIRPAIHRLKPGGKLIIDNWDQPSVWMPNDASRSLIAQLRHTIYEQEGHYDWKTLIATV